MYEAKYPYAEIDEFCIKPAFYLGCGFFALVSLICFGTMAVCCGKLGYCKGGGKGGGGEGGDGGGKGGGESGGGEGGGGEGGGGEAGGEAGGGDRRKSASNSDATIAV